VNIYYLAGGSATISHIISIFSSFAAPMRTTFSVEQTGASKVPENEDKEERKKATKINKI
jgi:hypothetical protein